MIVRNCPSCKVSLVPVPRKGPMDLETEPLYVLLQGRRGDPEQLWWDFNVGLLVHAYLCPECGGVYLFSVSAVDFLDR